VDQMDEQYPTARESEFLAEDELVEIEPTFSHPALQFISGTFGPLVAGQVVQVPLWLAVSLEKRGRCRVNSPPWMTREVLERVLQFENEKETFAPLPYHYLEIASLIFSCNGVFDEDGERIRSLLEDIENVRMAKLRKGINQIASDARDGQLAQSVKLNNVAALEIMMIRGFFTEAMSKFYIISGRQAQDEQRAKEMAAQQAISGDLAAAAPQEQTAASAVGAGTTGRSRLRRFR